ncbi:MAG: DUF2281 domain-containing protein [Oscillospiraceae bacterium]|nr:DUF2281 domain-containing protein [Oscillospiraceae bacterium]
MQAQAYEGYFEQGNFFTAGKPLQIPEYRKVYITILDEPIESPQISLPNRTTKPYKEAFPNPQSGMKKPPRELMFGYLRGEYVIANDFDAPLADFKEYME